LAYSYELIETELFSFYKKRVWFLNFEKEGQTAKAKRRLDQFFSLA
jgi:hypothetical protein